MEKAEYHCTFRVTKELDKRINRAVGSGNKSAFIKELLCKELDRMSV